MLGLFRQDTALKRWGSVSLFLVEMALAFSRQAMIAHASEIWAESSDRGTCFTS
jgi:hypothetical protein